MTKNLIHDKKDNLTAKSVIACGVFLLIFLSSITFIGIYYGNPNMRVYVKNYQMINDIFGYKAAPSPLFMEIAMWMGLSLLLIAFINILCSKFVYRKKAKKSYLLHIYIVMIIALLLISSALFTIAEYNYSFFYSLYCYIAQMNKTDNETLNNIIDLYSNNYVNNYNFQWSGDILSWWVCLFQTIMIIIYFSMFNNNFKTRTKSSSEEATVVKKNLGESKIGLLISKLSLSSEKNISIILLISSSIIFVTQFAFVINLSSSNSLLSSILQWSFIASSLLKDQATEFYNAISDLNLSYFIVVHLPIVASSFLLATICVFAIIYVKRIETTRTFFISQFLCMFIEILVVIGINSYSNHEINRLIDVWKEKDLVSSIANYVDRIPFLNTNFLNNEISYPWLSGNQFTCEIIISLCVTLTVNIILVSKMRDVIKKAKFIDSSQNNNLQNNSKKNSL
ncbi:hypothetical protein [Spiroplasma tabanidicola]|uniref:Uncharacterized protein n=1 Tax=Spiroplasma tabanidicola TaxID=324079 RepID=A0A6I6CAD4_9MOLU|nr:hypothetical protein [Spiroplasma tabanidicola]QGS52419.1 hypothetical protein STABA_v1c10710 [Spiroplasma tabanidicola]